MMKQWIFRRYGDQSVLSQVEAKKLELAAGELGVIVSALSINPIDWKLMSGKLRYLLPLKFPAVPCFDLSGVVDDANGVAGFRHGDKVFVRMAAKSGGAARTRVAVNAGVAAKMPEGISFEAAAAIPLAALTALQGLRDYGGMEMSHSTCRVLIVGASGGVGHFAVQIAAAAGAHVTAVCGTANVDMVRSLGADEVIDYRKQSHFKSADGLPYDIVFDCIGQSPLDFDTKFTAVMKPNGRYVTPAPSGELIMRNLQFWRRPRPKMFFMKPSQSDLNLLSGLFSEGKLKPVIDSVYSFDQLPEAFKKSISGRAVGKVVVTVH